MGKPDGGPAFPHLQGDIVGSKQGMSLRDWYAGQAQAGLFSLCFPNDFDLSVRLAWRAADLMLEERGRG